MDAPELQGEQSYQSNRSLRGRAAAEEEWLASKRRPPRGPKGSGATWNVLQFREQRIREAAYFKAQERGFAPGHELEDWVRAEQEVDRLSRPLPRQ